MKPVVSVCYGPFLYNDHKTIANNFTFSSSEVSALGTAPLISVQTGRVLAQYANVAWFLVI